MFQRVMARMVLVFMVLAQGAFDMFSKFRVTSSKKTKFSSLSQRLVSCFSSRVLSLATIGVALLPCVALAAPVLPAPMYRIFLQEDSAGAQVFDAPGSYAFGSVAATATGVPGATVSGLSRGGSFTVNGTDAQIIYYFDVVGPPGPSDVLGIPMFAAVILHASADGSFGGDAYKWVASAEVMVTTTSYFGVETSLWRVVEQGSSVAEELWITDFDGLIPFIIPTNSVVPGQIIMSASTETTFDGVADAYADPFIFIDPAFLMRNPGYSVNVSAGIGNAPAVAAVPEPATWALFASGLLGFVALRRRRV